MSALRREQLDDLMAIAEVWQWKAVHMGAAENSRRTGYDLGVIFYSPVG